MAREKFPLKKGNFWSMGQIDGDILFWSMPEPMVTFLELKIQHLLKKRFLEHPALKIVANKNIEI